MIRTLALALALSALAPAVAGAAQPKADVTVLAFSVTGELALVQESRQRVGGGTWLSFRVVGPGVEQKHYEVSNTLIGKQRIPEKACRATLVELRDLLRLKKFQGVTLKGDACKGDRTQAIEVSALNSSAAYDAEFEPSPEGDALLKGDLRLTLQAASVEIAGPKGTKVLRLPRPIAPESVHVLMSPTRRLLLLLQTNADGEQILAAGFSSKTGEIADLE